MSTSTSAATKYAVLTVPNQLTALRLLLAVVLFVLLAFQRYSVGLVLFLMAAATDWLDGYWARKYGQVTVLGRILDPFVDKVVVCGTFIFLVAEPLSGVAAWMATLIVGRELLITALRSFLEQSGSDFSASMSGKLKMLAQCIAAILCLYCLSQTNPSESGWLIPARDATIWIAIILTIYSGIGYIVTAITLLRSQRDG